MLNHNNAVPVMSRNGRNLLWSEQCENLLGSVSDESLANQWGVARSCVTTRRVQLQVPPFVCQEKLGKTEEVISLLESLKNIDVALVTRSGRNIHWSEQADTFLGLITDKALAKALGIARSSVTARRLLLDVPALVTQQDYVWTEESLSLLGTKTDIEVAKLTGIGPNSVARKRNLLNIACAPDTRFDESWTPERKAVLGNVTDLEASRILGFHPAYVSRCRRELKIKAKRPYREVIWTEEQIALLGKMHDSKLAALVGVREKDVQYKRSKLEIASFTSTQNNV